ncbi:MAG: hypothetical protein ACREFX_02740, partial [Opitutaceae bacterium]
ADVGAVTSAAARMTPVAAGPAPLPAAARSYRMDRGAKRRSGRRDEPAPDDPFDPILEALSADSSAAIQPDGGRYAALAPSFASAEAGSDAPGTPEKDRRERPLLLGYRDRSADPPEDPSSAPPPAPLPVLPRATLIPVYLLTVADTGDPAAVLQFAVSSDVNRAGRCVLPFGTRLLGRISGAPVRDRLNLTADTLLFPDGLERPIKAAAVEAGEDGSDIRPGVAALYVPPPAWVQIAPYVSDLFAGTMGLLQSRAQQQLSVGVGPVNIRTSAPDDLRGPAYQASSLALQDYLQSRLTKAETRYASYHWIPAGASLWLQLMDDLDLQKSPSNAPR